METSEGRTITIAKMVAWQIWSGNQHRLPPVPYPNLFLCILAVVDPGSAKFDELGSSYVRRYSNLVLGLLLYLGKTLLYWSCYNGKEGLISTSLNSRVIKK